MFPVFVYRLKHPVVVLILTLVLQSAIKEAYEVLSNPTRRLAYDSFSKDGPGDVFEELLYNVYKKEQGCIMG